jgi:hypothetical protein
MGKTPLARRLVEIKSLAGREGHEELDDEAFCRHRDEESDDSDNDWEAEPIIAKNHGGSPGNCGSRVSRGFLLTAESLKQLVPPNGPVLGSQRRLVMGELLVS